MKRSILALALLTVASGCDAPSAPASPEATVAPITFRYGADSNLLMDDLMEDEDLSFEYMGHELELEGAVRTAASAEAAAAEASRIVSRADGDRFQPILEETAANYFLAYWGDRPQPHGLAHIEEATATLVERESPEAERVWAGLQVIGDNWTSAQRLAAAEATLAAIDAAGLKRCMSCDATGTPFALSDEEADALFGPDADEQQREAEAFGKQVVAETARRDAAVRALEEIAG